MIELVEKVAPAPVTDAGLREALRDLLTTPCDCDEAWTARGLHAPDCRYSFVHAFLDDDEIEAVIAAAPATDSAEVIAEYAALARQAEKETA
jgi:hypothetical protein